MIIELPALARVGHIKIEELWNLNDQWSLSESGFSLKSSSHHDLRLGIFSKEQSIIPQVLVLFFANDGEYGEFIDDAFSYKRKRLRRGREVRRLRDCLRGLNYGIAHYTHHYGAKQGEGETRRDETNLYHYTFYFTFYPHPLAIYIRSVLTIRYLDPL